jgi:hypothetical protein
MQATEKDLALLSPLEVMEDAETILASLRVFKEQNPEVAVGLVITSGPSNGTPRGVLHKWGTRFVRNFHHGEWLCPAVCRAEEIEGHTTVLARARYSGQNGAYPPKDLNEFCEEVEIYYHRSDHFTFFPLELVEKAYTHYCLL